MGHDSNASRIGVKLGTGPPDSATDHIPDDYSVNLLGSFDDVRAQSCMDP
jgi:hypothetical protein